ncbi:MAG: FadR/GntR family transcriptional regulator [Terriglobales bacterium]
MAPAPKTAYESVRRNRIYEEIARQIEKMILEKMKPGDMLPPERQLAERFRVSRSSIRDAIRTLEMAGIVEPRQGSGTVVRELSNDSVVNPLASVLVQKRKMVGELLEVRKMIEPGLAARAARNATAEEIADMREILRRQKVKHDQGELSIEEDNEFHYTIALAADNSVVLKVLDVLMDLLRDTRERSLQVEGRPDKSLAGHQQILSAIEAQDAAAAETAMRQHIEAVEQIVLERL